VGIPFGTDEGALAGAIERVGGMGEGERLEWGRRALERARERYDWERVTDRYEELLGQCVGGRSQAF
jgi:glycosyltransferase involved in cell wall biosynthesis